MISSIDFALKGHGLIILKTFVIILESVLFLKNLGILAPGFQLNLPCTIIYETKAAITM